MHHQNNKKAALAIASAFAGSLAESLTKDVGVAFHTKVLDNPDLATRKGQPVHFRLTADGALRGECFVEFYEPQVAELASRILSQPLAPFGDEQDDRADERCREDRAHGVAIAATAGCGGVARRPVVSEPLVRGGSLADGPPREAPAAQRSTKVS